MVVKYQQFMCMTLTDTALYRYNFQVLTEDDEYYWCIRSSLRVAGLSWATMAGWIFANGLQSSSVDSFCLHLWFIFLCVLVCLWVHMWSEVNPKYCSAGGVHFLKIESLSFYPADSARLVGQWANDCLSFLLLHWDYKHIPLCLAFFSFSFF